MIEVRLPIGMIGLVELLQKLGMGRDIYCIWMVRAKVVSVENL
jgi:hypothetical protein